MTALGLMRTRGSRLQKDDFWFYFFLHEVDDRFVGRRHAPSYSLLLSLIVSYLFHLRTPSAV